MYSRSYADNARWEPRPQGTGEDDLVGSPGRYTFQVFALNSTDVPMKLSVPIYFQDHISEGPRDQVSAPCEARSQLRTTAQTRPLSDRSVWSEMGVVALPPLRRLSGLTRAIHPRAQARIASSQGGVVITSSIQPWTRSAPKECGQTRTRGAWPLAVRFGAKL